MATLGAVTGSIAAELGDPTQKWAKPAFLLPYVNRAWEDIYNKLADYSIEWPIKQVELLNVPANTADLSAFQTGSGALIDMELPTNVWWKLAGQPSQRYLPIMLREPLPDTFPIPGHAYYEIRGGTVYITPSSQATDIRVRYQAAPKEFADPSDDVMLAARNALIYRAAVKVAVLRGIADLVPALMLEAKDAEDTMDSRLVKRRQRLSLRIGSQRRPSRRTIPIVL